MPLLYTLLHYLALPLLFIRLWQRGARNPGYRQRWGERLALQGALPAAPRIWLHAVSVGETRAAAPLVEALLERYPQHALLITTTTPTGSEQVRRLFGDRVEHCYLPFDLPDAAARFLERSAPQLALVMETELWPNLFAAAEARAIPLLLINGRLSARSARGYRRFEKSIAKILGRLRLVAARGELDAERFRTLAPSTLPVHAVGNLKYDFDLPAELPQQADALRRRWGERPVWIAASTHAGEEELILAAQRRLIKQHPDLLLLLAPRHPERFDGVAELIQRERLSLARRSRGEAVSHSCSIYLADTMGELPLLYAASDIAFVAGSLIPLGGHNPLEPAALGIPILSGPHIDNFRSEFDELIATGAALLIEREIDTHLAELLGEPERRQRMGVAGRQVVERNRGARDRILELVDQEMVKSSAA